MLKKLLILILFVMLCFGCTSKYKLEINEDLSVDEKIIGLEDDKFYSFYSSSKLEVVKNVLYPINEYLISRGYSFENIEQDGLYGGIILKKYDNLDNYIENSKVYLQYYNSIDYNNENNIVTLSLNDKVIWNEVSLDRFIVDDGVISITLPFKVLENNADSHSNNTYNWNINSKDDKSIYIKFDTSVKSKKSVLIYILVFIVLACLFGFITFYNYKKKNAHRNDF